jgi:U3 small nucleolar RNA-associated protein 14
LFSGLKHNAPFQTPIIPFPRLRKPTSIDSINMGKKKSNAQSQSKAAAKAAKKLKAEKKTEKKETKSVKKKKDSVEDDQDLEAILDKVSIYLVS